MAGANVMQNREGGGKDAREGELSNAAGEPAQG